MPYKRSRSGGRLYPTIGKQKVNWDCFSNRPRGVDAATRIVGFFVSTMGMGPIFHGLIEAVQTYATEGTAA
jgi:hypothetical protein